MQNFATQESMNPLWLIVFFPVLWVFVCGLLAVLSGWSSLATRFRADRSIQGQRFDWVSGSLGGKFLPVSYGNCLHVTVGSTGVGLAIFPLFRAFSPPLHLPWREIQSVESKRILLFRHAVIRLRNHWTTIKISGKAGDQLLKSYAQATQTKS